MIGISEKEDPTRSILKFMSTLTSSGWKEYERWFDFNVKNDISQPAVINQSKQNLSANVKKKLSIIHERESISMSEEPPVKLTNNKKRK